jgi:hypothetical protein
VEEDKLLWVLYQSNVYRVLGREIAEPIIT